MVAVVFPISDREAWRKNIDRAELLLNSLDFFWRGKQPLHILAVCPDIEYDHVARRLEPALKLANLDIRLLRESDISHRIAAAPDVVGYAKQMLLKLAWPKVTDADYVLTLDADIVACKPFSEESFRVDGKFITAWAPPSLQQWWVESAKILNISLGADFFNEDKMHVTPQILCREICERLTNKIELDRKQNWIDYLLEHYTGNHPYIWTEYTLYYLFGKQSGLIDKMYAKPEHIAEGQSLHCKDLNIWGSESFEGWDPESGLQGSLPGIFIVMQSLTAGSIEFEDMKKRWLGSLRTSQPDYQHLELAVA